MTISTVNEETVPFYTPLLETDTLIKPYALMDLDDTLFQTQRKIDVWQLPTSERDQLVCASVDKQGRPLSFMTGRQQILFNWLLSSTELIVVTARDTQEVQRVKLPFNSWQVLTHGAVILQPDGKVLQAWQAKVAEVLQPLQDKIMLLANKIAAYNDTKDNCLKLAIHSDNFQPAQDGLDSSEAIENANGLQSPNSESLASPLQIYLAVKHKQKDHQALQDFAQWLKADEPDLTDDFYIHINANNLAILPHTVHKKHAVAFLLDSYLDQSRPSFGFGDSLADLPFLQLLDWYGTPNHGQLHDKVSEL